MSDPAPTAAAGTDPAGFEKTCLSLLESGASAQEKVAEAVAGLAGQNALVRQQVGQLYEAVRQLYDAVGGQCRQLLDSDRAVQQELQKFQTGGPQRAMAGVFHKLFRDLIVVFTQLDEVAGAAPAGGGGGWPDAVRVVRDRFERLLADWGCTPVAVAVGVDEFDPEVHEAAADGDPAGGPGNRIVAVRRRGWKLLDHVLQYPLVVVR